MQILKAIVRALKTLRPCGVVSANFAMQFGCLMAKHGEQQSSTTTFSVDSTVDSADFVVSGRLGEDIESTSFKNKFKKNKFIQN